MTTTATPTQTIGDKIASEFSADKHHLTDAEQRRLAGMIDAAMTAFVSRKLIDALIADTAVDPTCSLEAQASDQTEYGELSERCRIHSLLLAATGKLRRPLSLDEKRFAEFSTAVVF